MQLVADDLDVGPLLAQHADGGLGHGLPERVVLADDVHLLDVLVGGDHVGERGHLHVGVGVEAEVPVVALLVRQRRVHRRVIQVEDAVAGVALVVLLHGVGDRVGDAGAVALEHERDPVADDLLELDQALLRAHLVVERHDLELASEHASRLVDGVGGVLELVEPVLAGGREGPRQRVDVGDADGIGGRRAGREPGQQCHDHGEHENALGLGHRWPPWGGGYGAMADRR